MRMVTLVAAAVLCGAGVVAGARADVPGFDTVWFWSGAVTPTSAVVKARVRGTAADVHLLYGTDRELRDARRAKPQTPPASAQGGVVAFALDTLSPNTAYYYAVSNGTSPVDRRTVPHLRRRTDVVRLRLLELRRRQHVQRRQQSPDLRHHPPAPPAVLPAPGRFPLQQHRARQHRAVSPRVRPRADPAAARAACISRCPLRTCGTTTTTARTTVTAPRRPARPLASRTTRTCRTTRWSLQDGRVTTIQQQFTVGRVPVILSDLRSERDPRRAADGPGKSIMGARQRAWLDETFTRLAKTDAPLVIWVSSVPWITREGDPMDGWQPYSWERQWLADRLEALGLTHRMVMLAGDAHMAAIDDGTHSNYASGAPAGARGFPVIKAHAARPESQRQGRPVLARHLGQVQPVRLGGDQGRWPRDPGGVLGAQRHGAADSRSSPRVDLRGRRLPRSCRKRHLRPRAAWATASARPPSNSGTVPTAAGSP